MVAITVKTTENERICTRKNKNKIKITLVQHKPHTVVDIEPFEHSNIRDFVAFELTHASPQRVCLNAVALSNMKLLTHSFAYSLTHSLTRLLTHSLTHLLTHSLTTSPAHLPMHSLIHSHVAV